MSRLDELLSEIKRIDAMDGAAFPYEDCRKLQRIGGADASLIPDLDAYLSEIAGYRSWGTRVASWPDEKISDVERRISSSFFDRYPAHSVLRDVIDSGRVPNVRSAIARADETRAVLRDLLHELKLERDGAAT
ncbi:MAG TPA: hypothetical protein VF698_09555 [Thermoanaerobaculia bacterium]|jgi:hypothetical protein